MIVPIPIPLGVVLTCILQQLEPILGNSSLGMKVQYFGTPYRASSDWLSQELLLRGYYEFICLNRQNMNILVLRRVLSDHLVCLFVYDRYYMCMFRLLNVEANLLCFLCFFL